MTIVRGISCLLCASCFVACSDDGVAGDGQDATAPSTTVSSTDATGSEDTSDTPTSMTGSESPSATQDGSGSEDPSGDPSTTDDPGDTSQSTTDTEGPGPFALPPPDGGLDYQLGGAYTPPAGVTIVSRDRNASPEPGIYNICYINGFQAQPDEEDFWLNEHPDLVLRDGNGDPVIDQDWDEMLLDTSTPEKREALAEIVGGWIAQCGMDGFDAIEIDNLDSYSRSQDLLTQDNAVDFMVLLSAAAHDGGLAIAQKNSTELVPRKDEMGTDFVVAEECNTYSECGDYIDGYGDAVLMIEYQQNDFDTGCTEYPGYSIVLRDVDLVPEGDGGYVYDNC
ncbi:MAG TPA: endo alpha-1,4 polygalactosaminidase [Nannocystaceae bacterium]|nr:endo alpha-1,4 polygalactosaminidase [Nannocystaceae bacterium]